MANEAGETKFRIELKEKIDCLENPAEELTNKVEGMNADKLEQMDKDVRAIARKVIPVLRVVIHVKRETQRTSV